MSWSGWFRRITCCGRWTGRWTSASSTICVRRCTVRTTGLAIDPEVLFRMLLAGDLYGIKSKRRLEEEINSNIAYKWFCGLD